MESPAAPPTRRPRLRSPLGAAVLGWAVPGLGQVYAGRPRKGALYLLAILPTFLVGWWLTDASIVDPRTYGLDFIAQVFLGGPVAAILHLSPEPVLERIPRFFDAGRLYVQVAGLLNLVAICDAVGEVIRRNRITLVQRPSAPPPTDRGPAPDRGPGPGSDPDPDPGSGLPPPPEERLLPPPGPTPTDAASGLPRPPLAPPFHTEERA